MSDSGDSTATSISDPYHLVMCRLCMVLVSFTVAQLLFSQQREVYVTYEEKSYDIGDLILLPKIEYYLSGGSGVTLETRDSLDVVVEFLTRWPEMSIEIGIHTDRRGAEQGNKRLSEARARSVVNYLVLLGIDEGRLKPVGYGEASPRISEQLIEQEMDKAKKEALHACDRRGEVKILSLHASTEETGEEGK